MVASILYSNMVATEGKWIMPVGMIYLDRALCDVWGCGISFPEGVYRILDDGRLIPTPHLSCVWLLGGFLDP